MTGKHPPPLDQERLKAEFEYDQHAGVFTRIKKFHCSSRLGPIGCVNNEGYVVVTCAGRCYLGHRLAWLYVHGHWPEFDIDHINQDRKDNRLVNLRLATRGQNMRNVGLLRSNTSGYKGVGFHKASGKWRARAYLDNVCHYLGYFDSKEEAAEAYVKFAHERFGEFVHVSISR